MYKKLHPKIKLNLYDAQFLLKRLYCILVGTVITAQIVNTILSSVDEKNFHVLTVYEKSIFVMSLIKTINS